MRNLKPKKNKKILLLAVAFVSFATFTSCSKSDDNASLEGKWEYSKEGAASGGQEVLQDYVHDCTTKDYALITATSVADHTFYVGSGTTCEEDVYTISYTRSGNNLTIIEGGVAYTAVIKTLNGSTLKIYSTDPDSPGVSYVTVYKRVN